MTEDLTLTSGNVLDRDSILGFEAPKAIPVDAFGGTVYVRPLSGNERDAYEHSNWRRVKGQLELDTRGARARLFVLCVVDRDGNRLFNRADLERVGKLPASEIDKVTEVAREASGLSEEYVETATEDFDVEGPGQLGAGSSTEQQLISG